MTLNLPGEIEQSIKNFKENVLNGVYQESENGEALLTIDLDALILSVVEHYEDTIEVLEDEIYELQKELDTLEEAVYYKN